jgi:hypothetical protein
MINSPTIGPRPPTESEPDRDKLRNELDVQIAEYEARGGKVTQVQDRVLLLPWRQSLLDVQVRTVSMAATCERYEVPDTTIICAIRQGKVRAWTYRGEIRLFKEDIKKWSKEHSARTAIKEQT